MLVLNILFLFARFDWTDDGEKLHIQNGHINVLMKNYIHINYICRAHLKVRWVQVQHNSAL